MKTTFIYALKEPDTGKIRYVGKSNNPKKRLEAHLGRSKHTGCHREVWISSLKNRGLKPTIEILDEVPKDCWQQWESAWIQFYLEQGCDLTNATLGGEGRDCTGRVISEETRKKISNTLLGHPGMVGDKNPFFGKKHTEETLVKIRIARAKQPPAWLGKKIPPEIRKKMSDSRKVYLEKRRQEEILAVMWR